eukprot:scaffold712_cov404-Prasinococcus_capsulatus_cf.AAC.11
MAASAVSVWTNDLLEQRKSTLSHRLVSQESPVLSGLPCVIGSTAEGSLQGLSVVGHILSKHGSPGRVCVVYFLSAPYVFPRGPQPVAANKAQADDYVLLCSLAGNGSNPLPRAVVWAPGNLQDPATKVFGTDEPLNL